MTRYASRSSVQKPQVYDCLPVLAGLVHDKHTFVDVHHDASGARRSPPVLEPCFLRFTYGQNRR